MLLWFRVETYFGILSREHFKVRLNDPAHAAELGRGGELFQRESPVAPAFPECFHRDIEADLMAEFEAVGDGFCRRVNAHGRTDHTMFLDPLCVSQTGKLEEPQRQTAGAWVAHAVGQRQPHLVRQLGADSMKAQGGQQAHHPRRHAFSSFDEGLMFVAVESRGGVKSAGNLPHLLAGYEPAEIFARIASGDEIAGAKDPEPVGCICRRTQAGRKIVTFTIHSFTSRVIL